MIGFDDPVPCQECQQDRPIERSHRAEPSVGLHTVRKQLVEREGKNMWIAGQSPMQINMVRLVGARYWKSFENREIICGESSAAIFASGEVRSQPEAIIRSSSLGRSARSINRSMSLE